MCLSAAASLLIAGVFLTGAGVELVDAAQPSAAEPPHKDQPRPAGTASIAGIVTTSDGERLTRARVTLRSKALAQSRVAISDEMGRFTFDRLPGADNELSITRSGYALAHAAGGPNRAVSVRRGTNVIDQPTEVSEVKRFTMSGSWSRSRAAKSARPFGTQVADQRKTPW